MVFFEGWTKGQVGEEMKASFMFFKCFKKPLEIKFIPKSSERKFESSFPQIRTLGLVEPIFIKKRERNSYVPYF